MIFSGDKVAFFMIGSSVIINKSNPIANAPRHNNKLEIPMGISDKVTR